ncbi:hypothetical protein RFI_23659 [Reticulomyxa filosa]|uniref:Uncharacterized protein n=1 Tax=Reticulomyxa filosa TaxID=46433 RepID=X6MI70_RETFI|nr:hypothetical protein RFI_23659 [Reticulomyxa filosa]|eukprot:ETO13708.1 hypothetical protein RFI_23659 [Reticulomyxa filosa]
MQEKWKECELNYKNEKEAWESEKSRYSQDLKAASDQLAVLQAQNSDFQSSYRTLQFFFFFFFFFLQCCCCYCYCYCYLQKQPRQNILKPYKSFIFFYFLFFLCLYVIGSDCNSIGELVQVSDVSKGQSVVDAVTQLVKAYQEQGSASEELRSTIEVTAAKLAQVETQHKDCADTIVQLRESCAAANDKVQTLQNALETIERDIRSNLQHWHVFVGESSSVGDEHKEQQQQQQQQQGQHVSIETLVQHMKALTTAFLQSLDLCKQKDTQQNSNDSKLVECNEAAHKQKELNASLQKEVDALSQQNKELENQLNLAKLNR